MNYSNNQGYQAYSRIPRGWIIFAQIAGTIVSVFGFFIYIYYMQKIYNSLPGNQVTNKAVVSVLLAVISYFAWRTIYTAIVIVRFISHSSDDEISANRYIISALSLSLGGLFTPFLITSLPNVDSSSTIKPKYFLSKVMGLCLTIGAPLLALSYFLPLITGTNPIKDTSLMFNMNTTLGIISVVVAAVSAITFVIGLLTVSLFYKEKTLNDFNNNKTSLIVKILSTIWMIVLTIELALVITYAILRLLGAFADLFNAEREGAFALIFAFFNLLLTIWYVLMVIYVTVKTMTGIWSIDGTVKIPAYKRKEWANQAYNQQKNKSY